MFRVRYGHNVSHLHCSFSFAVHTNALLWFGDVWRRVNAFVLSCRASRFQLQFRKSSRITVKSASAGSASTFHRFVERLQPRFVHDITTTVCVCSSSGGGSGSHSASTHRHEQKRCLHSISVSFICGIVVQLVQKLCVFLIFCLWVEPGGWKSWCRYLISVGGLSFRCRSKNGVSEASEWRSECCFCVSMKVCTELQRCQPVAVRILDVCTADRGSCLQSSCR